MKTHALAPVRRLSCLCAALPLLAGCQSGGSQGSAEPNPALRKITPPPGATEADADRAALARFVGVWNFEGWSVAQDGQRNQAAGLAAAAVESEHFVLIDIQATSGRLPGRTSGRAGSMLLASEPGVGLTLTAWGDASPSISRLVGTAEGGGSVFSFTEARTPSGVHRASAKFTFDSDDRWTVEIRDDTASSDPVVASYRFTRAGP